MQNWLDSKSSVREVQKCLDAFGVPCSKVYTETDMEKDPHILENEWLAELPTPDNVTSMDSYLGFFGLADFSEGEFMRQPARDLGADTEEILKKYGK